jgi:hypothetical protein
MTEPSRENAYELALQTELGKLGVESISRLVLPGSHFEIDLYLPQLPRAAIEIKNIRDPSHYANGFKQLGTLAHVGRKELGETFLLIFVCLIHPEAECTVYPETPEGIRTIRFLVKPEKQPDFSLIARSITKIINGEREHLSLPLLTTAVSCALIPFFPMLGLTSFALALARKKAKEAPNKLTPPVRMVAAGSSIESAASHLVPDDPDTASKETAVSSSNVNVLIKQADSILLSFRELATDESAAAEHEMQYLIEEFCSGHYTSCALRAGRCLESMIYLLSRIWGIELRDPEYGMLAEVQNAVDLVSIRMGDLDGALPSSQALQETRLDKALEDLARLTMAATLAIKNSSRSKTGRDRQSGGPRPPIALLRRIQRRYGSLDGVSDSVNELLNSPRKNGDKSTITRILEKRNLAAHARLEGIPEEIDEASVLQLMDDINLVMLKLTNIGIAIRKNTVRNNDYPV